MKNPIDVFLKLVDATYWWITRQSPTKLRNHEVDTKPGDMLNKLSREERDIICKLTSGDISSDKVQEQAVNMAALTSEYYDRQDFDKQLREAKLVFDTKLKK